VNARDRLVKRHLDEHRLETVDLHGQHLDRVIGL
jgi:hypothetical protein